MKTYWKMRDGNLIDVDKMDINHLRNALKMVIRNSQTANKPAPKHTFELKGEMSQLFNESFSKELEEEDDEVFI